MSRSNLHRGAVNSIVIHCAASENGRDIGIAEIDDWHRARGFARDAWHRKAQRPHLGHVGYHAVILVDGTVELGRGLGEKGAQVQGHNWHTWGVCLIGADRFSFPQWYALGDLVERWALLLGDHLDDDGVMGHREFPGVRKSCPGFDVSEWFRGGMQPLDGHVFP